MVCGMTDDSLEGMGSFSVTQLNDYQCEIDVGGRKVILTDNSIIEKEDKKYLLLVRISTVVSSIVFLLSILVVIGTVGYYEYADYAGIACETPVSHAIIRSAIALALMYCSGIMIDRLDKIENALVRKLGL
jgi:hypothetical protein